MAGSCAHLSTMQTILSATASPLESRLEIYFNFHRSCIYMCAFRWNRRIPVWMRVIAIKRQSCGILSVPRDVWLLSVPSCCRDNITFIIVVALEFRVFSTTQDRYVLRLRLTFGNVCLGKQEIWIFVYLFLVAHGARCNLPARCAPLTAASRDMQPNDIRDVCAGHCECYNLWLWLLKARMMSTSQKINKNYSRTQFVRRAQIYQDGEGKHRRKQCVCARANGRFE